MYEFISNSETDTINFAKKLASKLSIGDVIVLSGDLGAGKTKFTQGILTYFNLENEISSPTFTIVNEYENEEIKIYHFDVYRLSSVDEFLGISIIEWGEIISDILPPEYLHITFSRDDNNETKRILRLEPYGSHFEHMLSTL